MSWLLGQAELDNETGRHAHRQIPSATRRALVARDRDGVFNGCHRPAIWCDGHHLVWWTRGGKTVLPNLALVCGATGAGQRPLGLIRRYPSGTFT